jgi:hypothetical protein
MLRRVFASPPIVLVLLVAPALAASVAACHLAESVDPPKCAPGTHPNNGHCDADPLDGPVLTISAADGGTSCAGDPSVQRPPIVAPATITVAPNGSFRFKNEDAVEHTITGADGQTWATAKPADFSTFIGLSAPGTWPFHIDGCAKGGVVVVQ